MLHFQVGCFWRVTDVYRHDKLKLAAFGIKGPFDLAHPAVLVRERDPAGMVLIFLPIQNDLVFDNSRS